MTYAKTETDPLTGERYSLAKKTKDKVHNKAKELRKMKAQLLLGMGNDATIRNQFDEARTHYEKAYWACYTETTKGWPGYMVKFRNQAEVALKALPAPAKLAPVAAEVVPTVVQKTSQVTAAPRNSEATVDAAPKLDKPTTDLQAPPSPTDSTVSTVSTLSTPGDENDSQGKRALPEHGDGGAPEQDAWSLDDLTAKIAAPATRPEVENPDKYFNFDALDMYFNSDALDQLAEETQFRSVAADGFDRWELDEPATDPHEPVPTSRAREPALAPEPPAKKEVTKTSRSGLSTAAIVCTGVIAMLAITVCASR